MPNDPRPGGTLGHLQDCRTVVLTTLRRNGTPVPTAVSLVVDPTDPAIGYIRTWSTAGKAKRIRNNPHVTVAPSTFRGRVLGPPVDATATLLHGHQDTRARQLLARKHPLLHGLLVPIGHRLQRNTTQHYALRPTPA